MKVPITDVKKNELTKKNEQELIDKMNDTYANAYMKKDSSPNPVEDCDCNGECTCGCGDDSLSDFEFEVQMDDDNEESLPTNLHTFPNASEYIESIMDELDDIDKSILEELSIKRELQDEVQTSDQPKKQPIIKDLKNTYADAYEYQNKQEEDVLHDDIHSFNIGSSDYSKHKTQPWDLWEEYNMNPWEADIQKRLLRRKVEPGMDPIDSRILDIQKIIHVSRKYIEVLQKEKLKQK